MATITTAVLSIDHDHTLGKARPLVTTSVRFGSAELQNMSTLGGRWFKLKCELWSKDTLLNDPSRLIDQTDDKLYTFNDVFYFPDGNPTLGESRTFKAEIDEGLLDEDQGKDEIYAIVRLTNLISGSTISRKSNVIVHSY